MTRRKPREHMRLGRADGNYMTEPRPRVFVNSAMDGYKNFRDAASDGIRQAGVAFNAIA